MYYTPYPDSVLMCPNIWAVPGTRFERTPVPGDKDLGPRKPTATNYQTSQAIDFDSSEKIVG